MHLMTLLSLLVLAAVSDGARFTASGEVKFPANYREWVFLTSGLGMTYGTPQAANAAAPPWDNVFVNPASYRAFKQTGVWPEGTMFILEIRESSSEGSINKGGHFQTKVLRLEAAVKDTKRYEKGWAYFHLKGREDQPKASAAPLEAKAGCQACHGANGAVENTFVQFYPELLEVAKAKGTLKPDFQKDPLHVRHAGR